MFQRRFNGSEDFFQNFASYKEGFGDVNAEHWLGKVFVYDGLIDFYKKKLTRESFVSQLFVKRFKEHKKILFRVCIRLK